MKDIPEKIFLQIDEYGKDAKSFKELETTWCTDKINKDDIEYILSSKYEELEQQNIALEQYLRIEKEVSDETIKELERQNIQLQTEYNESREFNSKLAKDNLEFIKENANLEQQKAELIEFISTLQEYDFENIVSEQNRLLKKHGVEI